MGRSRAERPSVSEVKVKITAYVTGHHNTQRMQLRSKQINKNMQKRSRRPKAPAPIGEEKARRIQIEEGIQCGDRVRKKDLTRVLGYTPWTGDKVERDECR